MTKVLVIGGAGFIGKNLIEFYSKNKKNKIDVIDNFSRGKNDKFFKKLSLNKNIRILKIDLSNKSPILKKLNFDYDYIFQLEGSRLLFRICFHSLHTE